jgi:hypothetical protein
MSTTTSGISFGGLLTIVFIVLKLVDIITWSWLWVLSPLWMPFAIVLGLAIMWFVIQWIVQR